MACPPARDSIEVEACKELLIDINPSDLPHSKWSKYCIYRVPKQLRKVNEEAYTPKQVSIGPFHRIHPNDDLKDLKDTEKYKLDLEDVEKQKLKYLYDLLKRKRTKANEKDLQNIIKANEKEIRDSYSEKCDLASDEFVNMILLDAVFIIELFLKDKKKRKKEKEEAERKEKNYCKKESDYILSKPWLRDGILHDLILLENQLPFFILVELYMSACCDEGQETKEQKEDLKKEASRQFVELSCNYFERYDKDKEPKSIIPIGEKVKHFADLLRYLLCPPNMKKDWECIMDEEKESSGTRFWQFCSPKTKQHWNHIKAEWRNKEKGPEQKEGSGHIRYCATKLVDARMKFKEVKGGKCLLDIKPPRPGVLGSIRCFGRPMEVPQLEIDDYTETLLRNLMALEQCHYPSETYICNYVFLLDHLIDDDKDVDLLVHKKVIHNLLGSSDIVAKLINKLCDQIVVSESSYFHYIGEKLNKHYEYRFNRTMATLKREYFPNVFRGTATVVGLIVLGFTFWSFLRPFVV